MTRFVSFVRLGIVALAAGCVHVAEERAARELEIGKTTAGAVEWEVEDGLAAVKIPEANRLQLWAQAPVFRVVARNTTQAAQEWELHLDNCFSDTTLVAAAPNGNSVDAVEVPRNYPTEKGWRIRLEPGSTELQISVPDADDATPWRFGVLSDVQEALDRVQDIYARMNVDPSLRFIVSAGDLTERGTKEELEWFQRELKSLRVPFFSTLGNHELGTSDVPYHDYFGRATYRFVFRGVQMTFADSGSATLAPVVYDWLQDWLKDGHTRTNVFLTHIPPVDPIGVRNGSFASRNEAAKLLRILADGGVNLTLYGHLHSFFSFSNAGIPAYVSGGGGAIPERMDGIGRHYLTVDIGAQAGVQQVALVRVD